MLVTLGAKTETPDGPLALLEACHGRIRRFLGLARALAERELPDAEATDVAAQVVRYFRVAFPLHLEDEDRSLTNRLQGRDSAVDEALRRMSAEHPEVDAQVEQVVLECEAIHRDRAASRERRTRLASLLPPAERAMEAHLVHEEQVLFPAARRLLSPAEQDALQSEMRRRRGA